MDKKYLDAKFEGIEKLVESQNSNLRGYIAAVSTNLTDVRKDLQSHKESPDAHGIEASRRFGGSIVQWVSLFIALVAAIAATIPLLRR